MRLYHFTCLFNLPWVLKEGITKGEVPLPPTQAMNRPNVGPGLL